MKNPWVCLWATLLGLCTGHAVADETKTRAAGKAALGKYSEAVVTVGLVVKNRFVMQGREGGTTESKMEITGTVLTPSGLTVVSDVMSNPAGLFTSEASGPKIETETSDVQLLLKSGREIPARFVLRDKDLDVAFVVPQEKGLNLPFVSFESDPVPEALDDLVFLCPLSKVLNREVGVTTGKVRAVVRKPRTFLVCDLVSGLQNLGGPAFDDGGRAVGLVVMRRAPNPGQPNPAGLRDMLNLLSPVVLMATDIREVAAQAMKSTETK